MTAISSVSTATSYVSQDDPFRQAFNQLSSALQSGNLSQAQNAYASLNQIGGDNSNSPFGQALQQIGDALNSGDVNKAQQLFSQLKQQMQATRQAHHHHHRDSDSDDATSTQSPGGVTPTQTTASSNLVDVTA